MTAGTAVMRLGLSFLLGMAVGYEREARQKIAGLKTHTLVSVGSCLVMIISTSMGDFNDTDSSRMAASVVSGIGFLGAGTILKEGNSVIGLTTAASLWVISAVGMAVGRGIFLEAFATAGLILVALTFFPDLERWTQRKNELNLVVNSLDCLGQTGRIGSLLAEMGIYIRGIRIDEKDNDTLLFHLRLRTNKNVTEEVILTRLSKLDGILSIDKK